MAAAMSPTHAELPLGRLNILRIAYLLIGLGLAIFRWPLLVANGSEWPLHEGVVAYMLFAMSLLALLGLRYPVKMIPLLLFECLWKLAWLGAVAVPKIVSGKLDDATISVVFSCVLVAVVLAVVPWDFVWRHYVLAPGDPWTIRARRPTRD